MDVITTWLDTLFATNVSIMWTFTRHCVILQFIYPYADKNNSQKMFMKRDHLKIIVWHYHDMHGACRKFLTLAMC